MNVADSPSSLIPVSVLTGFLGSGKTTVLNHLVCSPEMRRALVIINEFGAISLDHDLIVRTDEDLVVELMGGCLCCAIRGDLLETLLDAPQRFVTREGACAFDRVVIETTGLADPAPILHTLMSDERLTAQYRLDGVIATVDAAVGAATLDTHEEALKQAAVADRILLTKTDLISGDDRLLIERRLYAINPAAPVFVVLNGEVDAAALFNAGLYDPSTKSNDVQRWLRAEAYEDGLHRYGHAAHEPTHRHDVNRHDDRIRATCLTFDEPLDAGRFNRWLGILTKFRGPDVLRVKGILNLAESDKPIVIHGVQHLLHPPVMLDRWPSADRRTKLVFITRDISDKELRDTLVLLTVGLDRHGIQGYAGNGPEGAVAQALPAQIAS